MCHVRVQIPHDEGHHYVLQACTDANKFLKITCQLIHKSQMKEGIVQNFQNPL